MLQPCKYRPGSPERIQTYRQRVEKGVDLFHPGDRQQEAEELIDSIRKEVEKQRRSKQAETQEKTMKHNLSVKKLTDRPKDNETKTDHKTAELFNTNRPLTQAGSDPSGASRSERASLTPGRADFDRF